MRYTELRERWRAERAATATPVAETPTADMEAVMAALASDEQSAGNRHGGEGGGGGGAADLPSKRWAAERAARAAGGKAAIAPEHDQKLELGLASIVLESQ